MRTQKVSSEGDPEFRLDKNLEEINYVQRRLHLEENIHAENELGGSKYMKHLKLVFVALVAVLTTSAVATATPVCAGGDAVVAGFDCTLGGLTFGFTSLSFAPSSSTYALDIYGADTGVFNGGDVTLGFQTNVVAGVDITLDYTVTGNGMAGIDSSITSPRSGDQLDETACSVAPNPSCPTTDTLAMLGNSTSNVETASFLAPVNGTIWINKDITDNSGFSIFTDSVVVPEPMTLSLMGAGLLGIGVLGRRRRKS